MLGDKKSESVYLYDRSQRDLYLQELSLDKCPHQVQVYSLIDLEAGDSRLEGGFWKSHLQSCELCRQKAKQVHQQMQEIENLIPTPDLEQETINKWQKSLETIVSQGPLDSSLTGVMKNFWFFALRPAIQDFFGVLKRPKIQMLIWASVIWFLFNH